MRTDQEIIDQTNAIARIIYKGMGYQTPKGTEFHTEAVNRHPHERSCWNSACEIQELMTDTEVQNCIDNLEDD